MHKSLANISLHGSVEQSLHYARLSIASCAFHCGKTFRVFSGFGHSGTAVGLSNRLSREVNSTCLLAARKAELCNSTAFVCSNLISSFLVVAHLDVQQKRCYVDNTRFSQEKSLWSDKGSTLFYRQEKQVNNEDNKALSFSKPGTGSRQQSSATAGETVSLFSVDQIREQESPWKALNDIASADRVTRRGSPFKKRLQERKKICMLYGNLKKRALNRYLKEIYRSEELLLVLESRLDVVLKRSALFPSIHSARQSILQGGIFVNCKKVRSPRYHCTPGDLIQVIQEKRHVSKTPLQRECQTKRWQQSKDYLTQFDKWLDLFAFSELLQLGDRKIGRLYTSALSHVDEFAKTNPAFFRQQAKKRKASIFSRTGYSQRDCAEQDIALQEQSIVTEKVPSKVTWQNPIGCKRFQVDTPLTPLKNCLTSIEENRERLYQEVDVNTSSNSSTLQKKLATNYTSTNQVFTKENPQVERSRAVASRPLHLEVSYRNLCVVFLYPPQRICVDISLDLSLLV